MSREMDLTSDPESMDVLLGSEKANPLERKKTNTTNGTMTLIPILNSEENHLMRMIL